MAGRALARKQSRKGARRKGADFTRAAGKRRLMSAIVMEEARRAGLLDGGKTQHVSFRAPKALVDAAKRQAGKIKPTELGLLALAMLAQPDPAADFLKRTRGTLGADHQLAF